MFQTVLLKLLVSTSATKIADILTSAIKIAYILTSATNIAYFLTNATQIAHVSTSAYVSNSAIQIECFEQRDQSCLNFDGRNQNWLFSPAQL